MKQIKPYIAAVFLLWIAILLIPSILVFPFSSDKASGKSKVSEPEENWETLLVNASPVEVSVYRTKKDIVETFPIESYVAGVVASEMPVDFEEEALKAQSLAARTYIVRQLLAEQDIGLLNGADVGDTVSHQVFKNEEELKDQWGTHFQKNIEKIRKAVYETRGQIITYDNQPITSSYFSTSNGYTENSEDYWTNAFPYLKSVESPWDQDSPKFYSEKTFPVQEFEEKLGVQLGEGKIGEVLELTEGNRIAKIKIGDKELSGREVREMLQLPSSDFTFERKGKEVIVKTKGYGHGVGMSQYGANGMAHDGKQFDEIIKYYYQGVEITDASTFLEPLIVKK